MYCATIIITGRMNQQQFLLNGDYKVSVCEENQPVSLEGF